MMLMFSGILHFRFGVADTTSAVAVLSPPSRTRLALTPVRPTAPRSNVLLTESARLQELYRQVNAALCKDITAVARILHSLEAPGTPPFHPVDSPSQPPASMLGDAASPALGRHDVAPPPSTGAALPPPPHAEADPDTVAVPYDAPRWLAPRADVYGRAERDAWLEALPPYVAPDGRSAEEYRAAAAAAGLGFALARRRSGIAGAGDGVWLQGHAEMGTVVALYPGVVYPQVFHGYAAAPSCPGLVLRPAAHPTAASQRHRHRAVLHRCSLFHCVRSGHLLLAAKGCRTEVTQLRTSVLQEQSAQENALWRSVGRDWAVSSFCCKVQGDARVPGSHGGQRPHHGTL